jgi:predicted Zn-dependent peptidase
MKKTDSDSIAIPEFDINTYENGIRVVYKQIPGAQIAHCGIMFDIGSRDELKGEEGLAHFWEHMAFKGTKKRKSFHILNCLDAVGGELNAYTTKEKICFHATVQEKYLQKAIDLLTDIAFNSIFPEKELEKERGVILEEMSMYNDSPEDALQDEFDEIIFQNHPLGNNILGTEESLKTITRESFVNFLKRNVDTSNISFSCVSGLSPKKFKALADKYLKNIPTIKGNRIRQAASPYQVKIVEKKRAITQAHCAIGRASYSIQDEKRIAFFMLNNILGGPAMNSRLNLSLREKYGFVYSVDSSFSPLVDTGLMAIYFATEPKQLKKSIELIKKELRKLKDMPITPSALKMAKEQMKGQIAISEERHGGTMIMMAKSILDLGKIESLEEIFEQIDAITTDQLYEVANEMFDESQLSMLTFLPE